MQPVSASRKSSSQVFSAFNIAIMNVYMFLASDRSSHTAKSCRHVREIGRIITLNQWLKMRRGNVLSLTKDD